MYNSIYFTFNILYLYSTIRIFFQFQPKFFSCNKAICSTSTKNNFIQQQYLFSFNPNDFHSTKIIIQLLPKSISSNNNICSTSITIIFLLLFNNNNYSASIMHSYLITYLLLWQKFWKFPGHSKYRHSTKFPVPPSELPRTLSQIPSVLGTRNTESVKLMPVKSSTTLLRFFSVSPHSPSPLLHSLQTFRSNIDRLSRSEKIRLFCSLTCC